MIQFTTSDLQCNKQQSCYGLKNTIALLPPTVSESHNSGTLKIFHLFPLLPILRLSYDPYFLLIKSLLRNFFIFLSRFASRHQANLPRAILYDNE